MGIQKETGGLPAPREVSARSPKAIVNGESIAQNRFDGLTEAQYADLKAARYKAFRDGDDTPITLPNGFRFNPLDQAAYDALTVKATNGTGEPESPPQDATGEPKGNPLAIESPKRLRAQFNRQGIDCDAALLSPQPTDTPAANATRRKIPEGVKPPFDFRSVNVAKHHYENGYSATNFLDALGKLGIEGVRYNTRAQKPELLMPDGEWASLTDRLRAHLADVIRGVMTVHTERGPRPMKLGKDRWREAMAAACYTEEVDPFMEWLEHEVPQEVPPDCPKLDEWLMDAFGAKDTPLTRWASKAIFMACVQRAWEPGCLLREIVVLVSNTQGVGKSQVLRVIFPPHRRYDPWFTDTWDPTADKVKQAESLQNVVMAEAGELAVATRGDIDALKAAISRRNDYGIRLVWRENPEDLPRRCAMVGTTNRIECLPNDPSGNSRFVPVELPHGTNVEEYMDKHRMGLWAQALQRYLEGERANLPFEMRESQEEHAEQYRKRDELGEEWAARMLDDPKFKEGMRIAELIAQAPEALQRNDTRLANLLKQVGCQKLKRRKPGGKPCWYWFPPEAADSD